jgi:tetratricopeptide (TPR) repeat protein
MKRYLSLIGLVVVLFNSGIYAQNARKFFKVGEDFLENDKYEDAIDQFTKAIDMDPDFDKAYELRAKAYEAVKNYSAAKEDYEKLNIFDEKEETYYYNGARMSFELEDYTDALLKLDKALNEKRVYPEALK